MEKIKKGIIVINFDGVIVDTNPLLVNYINIRYRINITISDLYNISIMDLVNQRTGLCLTFDEFYLDFTEHFTKSIAIHKDIKLISFVKEVIPAIADDYYLFLSTARNSVGREVVNYVLDKHKLTQYFTEIHFAYSFKGKNEFVSYPKSDFISSFGGKVSYFIDDSKHEIEKAKDIAPSILLDPHYVNKVEGSWNARNWLEIASLVR